MNQGNTQTIASFTGTLLRREHKLGQKFVQLVFRENDKDVLCVSTNPRTVALPVGQTYRVQGEFKYRGEQGYVFDPKIDLLKKHWRPIRRVVFGAVLVGCLASLGGVAFMEQHSTPAPAASAANVQPAKPKIKAAPVVTTPPPVTTAPTPAPAVTTPTTVKPKTTVVKTAVKTVTQAAPVPVAVAPTVATPSNVCTTQSISFGSQSEPSDTVPVGSDIVPGASGSEQVCTLSGTNVTLQPVTEIISSGPATS